MKIFLGLLIFILPLHAFSQKTNLDSLIKAANIIKDDTAKVASYIIISNKYRVEKIDYPNAKKYALSAVELSTKLKFAKGSFKSTIALAYVTRDMGLHLEAIELLKKAIGIFENDKQLSQDGNLFITQVYTHTALADLYTYLPDYTNAQLYAFKALSLSEKYNVGIGQCWITISIIFSKQKNMEDAKKYAMKAVAYFKQNNAFDDLARAYAFLARYAYIEEDYTTAINYYQQTYETYKNANSLFGMRIALYNLAEIYLKIKNYDKADYYIDETLKINTSANDVIYLYYINQLKFDIEFDKKNYPDALKVAKLLLNLATNEKNLDNISNSNKRLLQVYVSLKDSANAFIISEKISTLKDSLYNIEVSKSTADLLKKYEAEKRDQQIFFLGKENKLNQEKLSKEKLLSISLQNENLLKEGKLYQENLLSQALSRENSLKNSELNKESLLNQTLQSQNKLMAQNSKNESLIRWLMTAALISFTAFGFNYYRNYKRQKLDNIKIVRQSEELKILMNEVHHRVKNNLQVIVAMLRMQARSIDNQFAIDALISSENRLQAIAMVHEKLYKTEKHGEIILKEYLQELMEVLLKQHQQNETSVNYQIIDNTSFVTSLDTAIPLGLIVNELVTNSFKYAFSATSKPTLTIQLNKIDNNSFQLILSDNGIGLPNGILPKQTTSLGLKLVKLFTEQLNGTLQYVYENGSNFTINFKPIVMAV